MAVVLGGLLLTAAALKLGGRDVSAVPQVGGFSAPWVQVAAAEWEIVLGLWLLSGVHRRPAWLAAVATFAGFAVVSGYLGSTGVASCGCFGAIHASPWWAFGVDIIALGLLAVGRPRGGEGQPWPRGALVGAAVALALVGVSAGVGTLAYGSPESAVARLRGDTLYVDSDFISFGDGTAGQSLTAEVRVRNLSSSPVRLIGGTSDCSCVTTSDLPTTLAPGGDGVIPIRLKLPDNPGSFTRTASLMTDCDNQRTVWLRLGGRVTE